MRISKKRLFLVFCIYKETPLRIAVGLMLLERNNAKTAQNGGN